VAVIAVADMFAITGRRSELVALLKSSEREAASQHGCRRYVFAATLAEPDRFVLLSEWDSADALEAHYRSEAFAEFQLGLHGLLTQPSEMTAYEVGGAVRPIDTAPIDPRDAD
jgi:quinol monooxygenase YgiN